MSSVIVMPKIMFSSIFKLSLHVNLCNSLLFMKIRYISIILACCIGILSSCQDDKPKYGSPVSIRVFGVTGKADLPSDMKVGLFVGDPVNVENEQVSVTANGTVVPVNEIKWAFDQSQASRFFAYAPYDESFKGQEYVVVNAPSDQSTEEKMLKGNLLTSLSSGTPQQTAVNIRLQHAMTAMTVSFDNRTGSKITALTVSGFMTEGKLNLITGTLSATGGKKVITPLQSPYGDETFSFIYIPQDATPTFNVTLASGKKIAFTYDNYCHEYPDKIIKMNIQIDESTPEVNILELGGVNTTQWMSNGIPEMPSGSHYTDLAGLRSIETDPKNNNVFSAFINKVTVTAVDRTDQDFLGVIIEDKSRALHVWTNPGTKIEVGNTIVGLVMGYMERPSGDELYITNFYTYYATIGKTDVLPSTQGRFGTLADSIMSWEYRRMLFKDVTLKEGFKGDRAVFVQDSICVSVVCPDVDASLAEGVKGDLIGFPVRSGSDIIIMVYDQEQFDDFGKEAVDNSFTRDSIYGLYDLSSPDTAIFTMNGPDMDYQYSVRYFDYGHTMQTSDTRNGNVQLFLVYGNDKLVVGHEYQIAFNVMCNAEQKGATMYMECVKVNETTAWLIDRSGNYGLILAL